MNREAELEMEIEIKSKLIKKVDTDAEDCDSCDSTYNLFCGHHQQMADIYFKDMKLLKAELKGIVDTENRIKGAINTLADEVEDRKGSIVQIAFIKDYLKESLFGGKDNES